MSERNESGGKATATKKGRGRPRKRGAEARKRLVAELALKRLSGRSAARWRSG